MLVAGLPTPASTRDALPVLPLAGNGHPGTVRTALCGVVSSLRTPEHDRIARTWRGWVRIEQAAAYVEYITRTGLSDYGKAPGNLGAQTWTADLGDGLHRWPRPFRRGVVLGDR